MNINTIRASIQSLLKADYIEVAGIEHRGNVLARTYTSKIKIEEYIISNFAGINNKISKKSLIAQFIKNEEDEEVINELEQKTIMYKIYPLCLYFFSCPLIIKSNLC